MARSRGANQAAARVPTARNPSKRARHAGEGSSMSRDLDLKDRFVSDAHMQKFIRTYATKYMINEKKLLKAKVDQDFVAMLEARKWNALMVIGKNPVNDTLVREFFANLVLEHLEKGIVKVREMDVPFTPDVINTYYDLHPEEGTDHFAAIKALIDEGQDPLEQLRLAVCPNVPWEYKTKKDGEVARKGLPTITWPEDWRVKCKFIQNRIFPKHNLSYFTVDDLSVLYALDNGIDINVGALIFGEVTKHVTSTKPRVIFTPRLIHDLCVQSGVMEYDGDHRTKNPWGICRDEIRAKKLAQGIIEPPPHTDIPSSSRAPSTLSYEARLNLSMNNSLRDHLNVIRLQNNALLANQRDANASFHIEDESRFAPITGAFHFEGWVETLIVDEHQRGEDDEEAHDDEEGDGEAAGDGDGAMEP